MKIATDANAAIKEKFGTVFAPKMMVSHFKDNTWTTPTLADTAPFPMDPCAHVLHYASAVFEGMKAHKTPDGIGLFRLKDHVARLRQSAGLLYLPVPDTEMATAMIRDAVNATQDLVPDPPGALYIRPTLLGTQPSIGAAASPSTEAMFYILLSPVGDYFAKGLKPLRLLIEDRYERTASTFGMAKAGGNYASALGHIMKARQEHDADQVLFCPQGDVQETGAANFIMLDDKQLLTKPLDTSFLHGVTRDSLLRLASDMGYKVREENIDLQKDLLPWIERGGEAALSGTAAVLAGVGEMVYQGNVLQLRDGEIGPNTLKLRQALVNIQTGQAADPYGWRERV